MKKLLLTISLITTCIVSAQDNVYSENCTSLTIGNVGTSLTGATAGQGGWYTTVPTAASPAGANTDFQIVDGGTPNGNCIQILGTSGSSITSQTRGMYKGFTTAWSNRTSGNDVVQLEYDMYSGTASASKNTFRNYIFSDDNLIAMAGFYFIPETLELRGWAQYDNAGTIGYYTFGLGTTANPEIFLDPNTWYRIGVSYDYNTGDISWKEANGLFYGGVVGANTGVGIDRIQYQMSNLVAGNTTASQIRIDNISLSFHAEEELLSTNTVSNAITKFSIHPNPSSNVFHITSPIAKINAVEITDINGRTIKSLKFDGIYDTDVNASDLSKGIYFMTIDSDKGTTTQKVIRN